MNINTLYDYVPPRDAFININIENNLIGKVLPEYECYTEFCLCIFGITDSVLDECLNDVQEKVEEYLRSISERIPTDILWDLQCKPVFLFENKETAMIFMDFANSLSEEDFVEFVTEVEHDYYVPWTHAQMISQSHIYEFLDHYERRFCGDQCKR